MINSTSKVLRNEVNLNDAINITPIIKYGVVKAIESDSGPLVNKGLGRIKVYIKGPISQGGDGDTTDDNLPWCFPMLPKHLSVVPKIGEVVLVFVFSKYKEHVDRLYLGPIISQLPLLDKDPFLFSALAGFSFGPAEPSINPSQIAELNGVFPKSDEISIQGRYNTDITQKKNEIVIRAGKFETSTPTDNNPYPFKFNTKTQAYIQIKNDVVVVPKTNTQAEQKGSVTNIVGSKINLITHVDGSPRFNVTNQDNLISDDELANILDQAHQLPFGDVLLQYLILMKEALFNHVHNGSGNAPTDLTTDGNKQSMAAFKSKADDLEKSMLSKNIRIN
jgi:hypothetical protein